MNFSGKQPNLIGPVMKSTVFNVMKTQNGGCTISEKAIGYISNFYNNYVADNIFIIALILAFVMFLVYRYNYVKNKEKFDYALQLNDTISNTKNLYKEVTDQTQQLLFDYYPSFDFFSPDAEQQKKSEGFDYAVQLSDTTVKTKNGYKENVINPDSTSGYMMFDYFSPNIDQQQDVEPFDYALQFNDTTDKTKNGYKEDISKTPLTFDYNMFDYFSPNIERQQNVEPFDYALQFNDTVRNTSDAYKEVMDQTQQLLFDSPPSFNPLTTKIGQQKDKVNYVPDKNPIYIPNVGYVDSKTVSKMNTQQKNRTPGSNLAPQPLNMGNYNFNKVVTSPSRSYYTGTYNTYATPKNPETFHPYGLSNRFNETTGKFVTPMVEKNSQNLVDYQNILDKNYANIMNGVSNK